jgi:hypothetical protein
MNLEPSSPLAAENQFPLSKMLMVCGACGVCVPLAFLLFWQICRMLATSAEWVFHVYKIQLLLWPSSILMIAAGAFSVFSGAFWSVAAASISANVLVYMFIGTLIWLGLTKFKGFLLIAPALVIIAWVALLSL